MSDNAPDKAMREIIKRLESLLTEEYADKPTHAHILNHCQEWLSRNLARRKTKAEAEADSHYDSRVAAHLSKFDDPEEAWRHSMDDDF